MEAMVLERIGARLVRRTLPEPVPGPGQVRIAVRACGVCRTDLHVVDGELQAPKLPLVLGHEVVGVVAALGSDVAPAWLGRRVGVPWLGHTCGVCRYCMRGAENLCADPGFTGYTLDGGYAESVVADVRYCFALPDGFDDVAAAPLLCAGLIGYRAYRMCAGARRIGLYGFGAAAHILAQLAVQEGRDVVAFTRPGDRDAQDFARSLGASWAGDSDRLPPEPLDAAILFAPVGALVPRALRAVDRGGIVVCGGIHMSDIPSFPYADLWHERVVRSVANLERRDGEEFFAAIRGRTIRTEVSRYPLAHANDALDALRAGRLRGAAVLVP